MPHIEVPKEYSSSEEFYDSIVKKSLEDKILYDVELTKKRVNSEKEVLKELGYIDYFLMLRELTEVAKKNNIPIGYSRGSGANCMSLYMMGVTQVDSIRWDLDFSRFANLGRKGSVADYDMDISQNKREEFITLIKEKYGYDKTMAIATFSTLTTKVAIRDIAKVLTTKGIYKIPYSIAHEVMNLIPSVKTLNEIDDEEVKDEQLKNVLNKIPKLREYYEKF
jgi:DNA polymerase-3 subunit alpha